VDIHEDETPEYELYKDNRVGKVETVDQMISMKMPLTCI
jgi:hypothetical protein